MEIGGLLHHDAAVVPGDCRCAIILAHTRTVSATVVLARRTALMPSIVRVGVGAEGAAGDEIGDEIGGEFGGEFSTRN